MGVWCYKIADGFIGQIQDFQMGAAGGGGGDIMQVQGT